jgi:hypothetical protein
LGLWESAAKPISVESGDFEHERVELLSGGARKLRLGVYLKLFKQIYLVIMLG